MKITVTRTLIEIYFPKIKYVGRYVHYFYITHWKMNHNKTSRLHENEIIYSLQLIVRWRCKIILHPIFLIVKHFSPKLHSSWSRTRLEWLFSTHSALDGNICDHVLTFFLLIVSPIVAVVFCFVAMSGLAVFDKFGNVSGVTFHHLDFIG